MEMEYGVEFLVLVENVLGEAYVLFHEKFATYKVAPWAAGEVELLHVCAATYSVAESDLLVVCCVRFVAGGNYTVVEVQHLRHFAAQFFNALPVACAGDKGVVAVDKFYVCSSCFIYAAVACCAGATVCGCNELDVEAGVRLFYPQWWGGGTVIYNYYLKFIGRKLQLCNAFNASLKQLAWQVVVGYDD